jgi:hypothetical protein
LPSFWSLEQKRIATKFVSNDGQLGMPAGTLVQGVDQDMNKSSFYINGTAPPFSTPKPVRFIIAHKDDGLPVSLSELSWALMHDYSNWPGPIKVPSVCQLAHKLAEFAGNFNDCGDSIDHQKFTNKMHFL